MDSESIFWPETLPVPLVNPNVVTSPRNEQTVMESGRVRTRPLVVGIWEIFEVQWNFVADKFDEFKTFFDTTLVNGSLAFVIDIFGEETEVRFLEPNYSFQRQDNLFTVSARLCTL